MFSYYAMFVHANVVSRRLMLYATSLPMRHISANNDNLTLSITELGMRSRHSNAASRTASSHDSLMYMG